MTLVETLPTVIASLNAACFAFLVAGLVAVKRGKLELHRKLMLTAVAVAAVFLIAYLTRVSLTGTTYFQGTGWRRSLYLFVLLTHMPLAALVVPMCLRALYLAFKQRYEAHRRLTRWLWPIWCYVSVTGVAVYFMLRHWNPE